MINKNKVVSKLDAFIRYIAEGDEALTDELNRKGPVFIIATAVTISTACSLLLILWVVS